MNTTSRVTPYRGGRLGNNVIHAYKAFWFACIHGLPLNNVLILGNESARKREIFRNLAPRFVDNSTFGAVRFNVVIDYDVKRTDRVRNDIYDIQLAPGDNVSFIQASLYPELPWEKALFISLFDNPDFRFRLAHEYRDLLSGTTVGYTIRRTDILNLRYYRPMTELETVLDLRNIVERHHGLVKIVVTSDDIPYVRRLLAKYEDLQKHVFVLDKDEDTCLYLLSMCDSVVCNGEYQVSSSWTNHKISMFASTFGQIAQLLNRSYRYSSFPLPETCDIRMGVNAATDRDALPDFIKDSRIGSPYEYPDFIR